MIGGNIGINARALSGHIRRYLIDRHGDRCMLCGWHERNQATGKVPIEIDHIDGDSENSSEKNLRLICPNCHSLTLNFRGLNMGYGRKWRK
ncbi:MAG: HNH endonuclease [Patescibacteria group bacterium]|nr:HNH endonuclease [Patescibacteria group bacterium]